MMCSDYVRDNVQLNFTFKIQKRFNSQWIMSGWVVLCIVLHIINSWNILVLINMSWVRVLCYSFVPIFFTSLMVRCIATYKHSPIHYKFSTAHIHCVDRLALTCVLYLENIYLFYEIIWNNKFARSLFYLFFSRHWQEVKVSEGWVKSVIERNICLNLKWSVWL